MNRLRSCLISTFNENPWEVILRWILTPTEAILSVGPTHTPTLPDCRYPFTPKSANVLMTISSRFFT